MTKELLSIIAICGLAWTTVMLVRGFMMVIAADSIERQWGDVPGVAIGLLVTGAILIATNLLYLPN
jgi:hypothetical protein